MSHQGAVASKIYDLKKIPDQPWKNGGGRTREIAKYPATSSLSDPALLWRLSRADIIQDGAFSDFPGFKRWLGVVKGRGLNLFWDTEKKNLARGDILNFEGAPAPQAILSDGPVSDLGLIYRADLVQAEMHQLLFQKKVRSFEWRHKEIFFYPIIGSFRAEIFPGGEEHTIEEGSEQLLHVSSTGSATAIVSWEPLTTSGVMLALEISTQS